MRRATAVGGLLVWWAVCTAHYLPAWDSPTALATHMVRWAPQKPRVLVNYGTMLAVHQQWADARRVYNLAIVATALPHVPAYDRDQVVPIARANLTALATLEARTSWPVSVLR